MLEIIAKLINDLTKLGFHKDAGDMMNLLNDLMDDEEIHEAIHVGLREDGTGENMNQGFSVEPRYFM